MALSLADVPEKKGTRKPGSLSLADVPEKKSPPEKTPAPAKAAAISLADVPEKKPAATRKPRVPIDPATGRVIDPISGKPFPMRGKGPPVEAATWITGPLGTRQATPSEVQRGLQAEKTLAEEKEETSKPLPGIRGKVELQAQQWLNRSLATLAPVRDFLNVLGEEQGKATGPYKGKLIPASEQANVLLRALQRARPWEAFKEGLVAGQATNFEAFQNWAKNDPTLRAEMKRRHISPAMLDFIASFAVDPVSGKIQSKAVSLAQKGAQKAGVLPRLEKAIPRLGREMDIRRGHQDVIEAHAIGQAQQAGIPRRAGEIAENVLESTKKQGGYKKVRTIDPITGEAVSEVGKGQRAYIQAGHETSELAGPRLPGQRTLMQQRKRAERMEKVLPKRQKQAASATVTHQEKQQDLLAAEHAKTTSQQALMAERTALKKAKEQARLAREKTQAAQRQAVAANTLKTERETSVANLRSVQQRRIDAARKAEQDIAGLERDAQAAAKQHAEARTKTTQLQSRLVEQERRLGAARQSAAGMRTPKGKIPAQQAVAAARADADALKSQMKQASANEARMLEQSRERTRELDKAKAELDKARRLTPSTGVMELARKRAQEAAQKAEDAKKSAGFLQIEAKQQVEAARQAQIPVTAATREAGKAQARLYAQQTATTKAGKTAARLTDKAQSAQLQTILLKHQTSGPFLEGVRKARRANELGILRKNLEAKGLDYDEIARVGKEYQDFADEVGQRAVAAKLITPAAYEDFRGYYMPHLYMLKTASPAEAGKLIDRLEQAKTVTAQMAAKLRGEMSTKGRGFGRAEDFARHRKLETYAEQMKPEAGRILAPEAAPAFSRYAESISKEIGEANAWEGLRNNRPDLVLRGADVKAGTAQVPTGWSYNSTLDAYIHPGVDRFIQVRDKIDKISNFEFFPGYRTMNKALRRHWIGTPRSASNNAVGNYALAMPTAQINGASKTYTLENYAQMRKEFYAAEKPGATPSLRVQQANERGLLGEGSSALPESARKIGGGFGVETPWEIAKGFPGRLARFETTGQRWYSNKFYGDVEKVARLHLFDSLIKAGRSPDEAARIVKAALIDYSNIGTAMAVAERHNLFPFATFPSKAIWQYLNTAARRPDIMASTSGEKLRNVTDAMADELSEGKAQAKEKRRRGEVSMLEFALPGLADERGAQRYLRAPIAAPVLQMFPANPDADVVSERIKGAAPLIRVPQEIVANRSMYTGRPIVPEGLPPGSLDAPRAQGLHILKAILPWISDAEAAYHAITGTQPYPSKFAAPPETGSVALRFILGASEREGTGEGSLAGRYRAAERVKAPEHKEYQQHFHDYWDQIRTGEVPLNEGLVKAVAAKHRQSHTAKAALAKARLVSKGLLTTSEKTGEHRLKAIEDQAQYRWILIQRWKELVAQERASMNATGTTGFGVP